MIIPITEVESHQIFGIGYDAQTRTLAVQFRKGKDRVAGSIYHYAAVTPAMHNEFMHAPSKGKYFNECIKPFPQIFPFTKQESLVAL